MTTTTIVMLVWGSIGWGSGVYWAGRFGQQREALEKIAVQNSETIRLVNNLEGTIRESIRLGPGATYRNRVEGRGHGL